MSLPATLSPIRGKFKRGNSAHSKVTCPNSNALAYTECTLSTYGRSTSMSITFSLVDQSSQFFQNPLGNTLEQVFSRFLISQFVYEPFAVKLKNCAKSCQILRFLPSHIFGVRAPKICKLLLLCPPYGTSYGKVSWSYSLHS